MKTIRKGNNGSKVLQGKWLGCVLALLMVLVPATEAFAAQVTLDVSKAGSGAGTVTSSPPGIDCGSVCLASYETSTLVTLTAVPDANSTFTSWTGSCFNLDADSTGICVVNMRAAQSEVVTFTAAPVAALTVSKIGAGTGTVSSTPSGINCGRACLFEFAVGTSVTLTATPDANSTFSGWSGGGCNGTGTCTVALNAAQSVSADFTLTPPQLVALTVNKSGTGTGTVSSTPAGINCGVTCAFDFTAGTSVTLTATADANSTFSGWSGGGCDGTGACAVTMDTAQSVTATFTIKQMGLAVNKSGTGTGSVSCNNAVCAASYATGTPVTLTAVADASSTFMGWSGAGCSGTGACAVTMDTAQSVTATFTIKQMGLAVNKSGTGTGSVSCNNAVCAASYATGTSITLTAVADASSTFTGWSGGGCSGMGSCTVTMNSAQTVTATFTLIPPQTVALTVNKSGTGTGSVSCNNAVCAASYATGMPITLTAVADASSTFMGWSDSGCSGTGACAVTMDTAQSVTATFTIKQMGLAVNKSGTGTGSVSCNNAVCAASYATGTSITLTAVADASSTFMGWSGAGCSGTGVCMVTMSAAQSVTATFTLIPPQTVTLTVNKTGTGTGSVSCNSTTCAASYVVGTPVTLTAAANAGSTFTGWSGGGCSGTVACTIMMNAAQSVTATFTLIPPQTVVLTVNKAGTGAGNVSCNNTICAVSYVLGTPVNLTAVANAGSTFTGWSGAGCSGTAACTVTMNTAQSVTATFTAITPPGTVTVSKNGTGVGTVSSNPAGINCGATCSANFVGIRIPAVIILRASPNANSVFTGWGGACSGSSTLCRVSKSTANSVSATFTLIPPQTVALTVNKSGTGTGSISCNNITCAASYVLGTPVNLTAAANAGSTFTGWSGAGCSGTAACTVTMNTAQSVTATFTAIPPAGTLTVTKNGTGGGVVTSIPAGINCGSTCSANFAGIRLQTVRLTARPDANSVFTGWGGACSGTGSCTVTVNQDMQVSASFQTTRFFKISGAGIQLPATAGSWNCVKDNNTGLVWEIKTNINTQSDLHSQNWSYSWYDPNSNTNGGNSGTQNRENRCGTGTGNTCNTDAYVKAVNSIGWCGAKNWRLPTREELAGIVDTSKRPTIDPLYFPNTVQDVFWTSTTDAQDSRNAWYVYFANGGSNRSLKSEVYRVRLVHQ